ncbi:D-arabinono-1,4-lactone oxidase [Paracoccus mutanolyticus]|uniref:D-arabinono-1,4-lactone oxidase n=1 Tax=Paracoccus mutanolyticus TaxID=1499308 RepID=UPI001679D653|nr:D-arabinono-1,4-lactone oxidase [Paracoccus mutanolyticus]
MARLAGCGGRLRLTGEDVTAIYPRAEDFRALRRKLDPQGVYLNDHLSQLFR